MQEQMHILLYQSAIMGRDSTLIQGAGGNVSLKDGDKMLVKASGTCLREAEQRDIFVTVSRSAVLELLESGAESFASLTPEGGLRPSIETPLHALMPHSVVVHAHCVNTIARTVMGQKENEFSVLLGDLPCAVVPYERPGLPLACAVRDVLHKYPVDILILQNHGIIVGGESVEEAFALLYEAQRRLNLAPRQSPSPDTHFLGQRNDLGWTIPDHPHWHGIATDAGSFACACAGPLYPDHVVFLGGVMAVAHQGELLSHAAARFEETMHSLPRYMLYENKGILVAPDVVSGEADMLDALSFVCARTEPDSSLQALGASDIAQLLDWDAEKFRKMLAKEEIKKCSGK